MRVEGGRPRVSLLLPHSAEHHPLLAAVISERGGAIKTTAQPAARLSEQWPRTVRSHEAVAHICPGIRQESFVCSVYVRCKITASVNSSHDMPSLHFNESMLFLLLRTTLFVVTTCVATSHGAPVQSDTQAMVRKCTTTAFD